MLFHLSNSSIHHQKLHQEKYKQFLKTLQTKNIYNNSINRSEKKFLQNRQINLQSRQNKRKLEYERIQNENLRLSEKLINAKPFLNQYEQKISFDKHYELKQRLQRYPNLIQTHSNSSFLIYNDFYR